MTITIEPRVQAMTETEKRAITALNNAPKHLWTSAVARRLGVGLETARDIIFEIRKKEAIIMGRLTNIQRTAIYQGWKDGQTMTALADQYDVSNQAISALIRKMKEKEEDAANEQQGQPENAAEKQQEKLPAAVRRAIQEHIQTLQDQIDQREQRISELRMEQEEFQKDIDSLRKWEAMQK